jgi:hypothetical protein
MSSPHFLHHQRRNVRVAATQEAIQTGLTPGARVRRKAGQLLIALCRTPPACFLDSIWSVCERVQTFLNQPELSELQRR